MSAVNGLLLLVALLAALPALVLLAQCLAALLPPRRIAPVAGRARPRVAVLVPAHDEEAGVGATVAALVTELDVGDRLIVVADNCTDGTASRARAAGHAALAQVGVRVEVIERRDPDRRGKGFAIQFGLEHLDADPPDVVILVDADCRISAGGLSLIAQQAFTTQRPVQAEYLLEAPENPSGLAVVSALAVLVRNRVRPRGMARLGFPCQLTGSGMAFAWRVLREAPETGANLVEDLVMGIEMAKQGHPPLLCPQAQVTSELPVADTAAMKQRRRWEHGQMQTLLRQGPALVATGLLRLRPALVGMGLDLIVPPLAVLVMTLGALFGVCLGARGLHLASGWPALVSGAALAAVAVAVLLGWARFARQSIPGRALLFVPLYVLWKIPLYLSALLGRRQKAWERTERAAEATTEKSSSAGN